MMVAGLHSITVVPIQYMRVYKQLYIKILYNDVLDKTFMQVVTGYKQVRKMEM